MATKINIFDVLHRVNTKDANYYAECSAEEQKQIQPFVLMRWMSGTSNPQQIILLNEFANPFVFSLYKHKELQWMLLTACAPGKFKKYNWIKAPTQATSKKPLSAKVLKETYNYSETQANQTMHLTTGEHLIELATALGWQDADLAKLGKEWDITIKVARGSKKNFDDPEQQNEDPQTNTSSVDDLLDF